jgi:translation initiation factor 1
MGTGRERGRTVYSTATGGICPKCGWPQKACRCAANLAPADEPVPEKIVARLSIERAQRGGKTVTAIAGLPRNEPFLAALASELKRACGTGGTVADGRVEIQGDQRERLRELLARRGWTVKG